MKTPEELKALYGKQYVEQLALHEVPLRLDRLLGLIQLHKDTEVVDFACGNGMLMDYLAPKVQRYVGVDFSPAFIASATHRKVRLNFTNAEFVCADIREFCRTHVESFDVGFALDFSEHVYDKEWLEILKCIRVSLKESGKLYLHTPNAEFFLEIMKQHDFMLKQFPEHIAVRSPKANVLLLEEAGFKVSKLLLLPHYNFLRYLHPLSYLPVIGKYLKARIFIEAGN